MDIHKLPRGCDVRAQVASWGFDWILGKTSSLEGLSSSGTGYPEKQLSHHPWRYLKDLWMWCLGTWCGGGLDGVRVMVGLGGLKGHFQPKWFCDYMTVQCTPKSIRTVPVARYCFSVGSAHHGKQTLDSLELGNSISQVRCSQLLNCGGQQTVQVV